MFPPVLRAAGTELTFLLIVRNYDRADSGTRREAIAKLHFQIQLTSVKWHSGGKPLTQS